ncbi:MAG: DUF1540 domain-containing protein [Clostridia bacterium]|nr:DUF1540 domain-containing protein [Clostridia bacterium]
MNTNKTHQHQIPGVSCDAKHCIYNRAGNVCEAGRIDIGTNKATSSSETICATFKCKSENM